MNVEIAKNMEMYELKDEYRKYLYQLGLDDNTVNTSSNNAFYLWKNASKEMFWEKILSENFAEEYKATMLELLRIKSKGNPEALISGYMSHARKFRAFLGEAELVRREHNKSISRKKDVNDIVPTPSIDEVELYLKQWDRLENYHLQEDALDKLFLELCPENKEMSDVLLKVATLNDFYSTNIFSVYPVAKHILALHIDERLKKGDVTLVRDIQKVTINDVEKNFYSFATKYCSHHNPLEFPIYDSYVEKVLKYFRDRDGFSKFKNDELKNYPCFKEVLVDFRKFYGLNQYNLKLIDRYIWQLGKKYFPKQY